MALLSGKLSGKEFARREEALRQELLDVQRQLAQSDRAVLLIISGMDGAGKGEVINRLGEWLDPRGIETWSYRRTSDEEEEHPRFWRYWRTLPAHGRLGIHFGAWYTRPIIDRSAGACGDRVFQRMIDGITRMEQQLADNGTIVLKFWLHLPCEEQQRRLDKLESDPKRHWQFTGVDWNDIRHYDDFDRAAREVLQHTDRPHAPWIALDATDDEFRDITVGEQLVYHLRSRLASHKQAPAQPSRPIPSLLARTDPDTSMSDARYEKLKRHYQSEVYRLTWKAAEQQRASVLVFEGWDAAGKGGAIRRLTRAIDAQLYRVIPVAAPSDEERAHHYLWRFWRTLPRDGDIAIFDRSWYGRVLVERVEQFATEAEWRRAYDEINEFERELAEHGVIVVKFWLHISDEEQLRRFRRREDIPYKQFKITDEDWRNRSRRAEYEQAVDEMLHRTGKSHARWHVIPANDKQYARIAIMKRYCEALRKAL